MNQPTSSNTYDDAFVVRNEATRSSTLRAEFTEAMGNTQQYQPSILSNLVLPVGFSRINDLDFLTEPERRFYSQVEGRTFVSMYSLLKPFTNAGLQHQGLLTDLEKLVAPLMPIGYVFTPHPQAVTRLMLSTSNWAVKGMAVAINQIASAYHQMIDVRDTGAANRWQGLFGSLSTRQVQGNLVDAQDWIREDKYIGADAKDLAVDDLIELLIELDDMLQAQAHLDAQYFAANCFREFNYAERNYIERVFLKAYRFQIIVAGVNSPLFAEVLGVLTSGPQLARFSAALKPIAAGRVH